MNLDTVLCRLRVMAILPFFSLFILVVRCQFVDHITLDDSCSHDQFKCSGSNCISKLSVCDGFFDCPDGSDEDLCGDLKVNSLQCTGENKFTCQDQSMCLDHKHVCNGVKDCDDGSDEANCHFSTINSTCHGFRCKSSGECISAYWICDGHNDCTDQSDEDDMSCFEKVNRNNVKIGSIRFCPDMEKLDQSMFFCRDKSYCIDHADLCNGVKDCRDSSDEDIFCGNWTKQCETIKSCVESCIPTPNGPQCKCGHLTVPLNQTCSSVDFCKKLPSTCSQLCTNGEHSYICTCDDGYRSAGNMCYAMEHDPILFYTTKKEIKSYDVKTNTTIVLTLAKYASSVTSDGTHMYWIEKSEGNHNVMKANLDSVSQSKEVLLGIGIDEPADLAIDWMAHNVYFTEPEHNYIGVCTNTGSACARIRNSDIRNPRLITLNPETGTMYWSDYIQHPRIQQSKMDGSNAVTLTMNRVYPPSALTVDIPNGKLYWAESEVGISVINFDGSGKYEFLAQFINAPNCLNIFENDMYWNDQSLNVMQSSSKMEGEARRKELFKLHEPIIDASLYHPILQKKKSNPCSHSLCSNICVITSNTTYVCMCGEDSILNDDKHTCKKTVADKSLLVGGSKSLTKILFHALTKPEKESVTLNIGRIQAMAYNPHEDLVYIYDGNRKVVFKYAMSKFGQEHIEVMPIEDIENIIDMGYDYLTDNLYYINVGLIQSTIGVYSTRTSRTATVHVFEDDETTVSMCVLPEYGTLMVAVYNTRDGVVRLDRFGMDGKDHNTVFKTIYEGFQVNVKYSHLEEQIYISDSGKGLILQMHPEGTSESNFREISTAVSSMAIVDRVVFWTDKHMPRLFWANADDHVNSMGSMMMQNYTSEYHLHLVGISGFTDRSNFNHPCTTQSNCAHICVQSKHRFNNKATAHTCLCPFGQVPKDDQCVKRIICPYGQLRCYESNTCYNKSEKCDGIDNCPNGEDEMNCEEDKNCKKDEFMCPSSDNRCIAKHQLCDGYNDCSDGSDEESQLCSFTPCESDMFMCENGFCIMRKYVCDNEADCTDGSDERGCVNSTCSFNDFRCNDGQCIDIALRCDGSKDCIDWSDEKDCLESEDILPEIKILKNKCSETEYACPSNRSICLPQSARCDLKNDCPQKEDERGCAEVNCVPGYFRCRHGRRCISQSQVCDTSNDCEDGSDETTSACWEKKSKERGTQVFCDGFKCGNGDCISSDYVCDGYNDCADGSDENHMCKNACKTRRCHHICIPTPQGARCLCHDGYELDESSNRCKDIDECERDICSHECTNIVGSYVCSCYEGYSLRADRHSCKSKSNVKFMYISERVLKVADKYFNKIIYYSDPNVKEIIDMAYEPINDIVYVTTTGKELISINKDGGITNVSNIGTPTAIGADWITGNIYIVDATMNNHSMKACNLYKGLCVTIAKLPPQFEIHHLSVDSINRYIFYCGTYRDSPRSVLYKINIINMKTEALREIYICTGLTLDYHKQSVYVLQTNAVIAKISYDGTKSEDTIRNEYHFKAAVGLQLFEDYLYTIDISNLKSIKCLTFGSMRCEPHIYRLYRGGDFALIHRDIEILEAFRHCNVTCSSEDCEERPECLCYQGLDSPNDLCLNSILSVQVISSISKNQENGSSHVLLGFSIAGVLLLLCCCLWVCRLHAAKRYRFDRDSWISCFKSTRRRVWSSNILRWRARQSTKSCTEAIVDFQTLPHTSDMDPTTTGVQNTSYVTWMYSEQDSNVAIHMQKPDKQCCTEPRFCTQSRCCNKLVAGRSGLPSVLQSRTYSASPRGNSSDTESELDVRVPLF